MLVTMTADPGAVNMGKAEALDPFPGLHHQGLLGPGP